MICLAKPMLTGDFYEGYSESKDTSPVKMQGNFFSEMAVLPCEIGTV
jgi:hypothetical protein